MSDAVVPRAASTVVLLRERDARFEVLLVRRSRRASFMAGAYVFPGGALDPDDASEAMLGRVVAMDGEKARLRLGDPELDPSEALALHVAGVRETFEESGVLVAHRGVVVEHGELASLRMTPFAEVMARTQGSLLLERLAPLSRWITPRIESRRFDTRFFLALAETDQEPAHDEGETTDALFRTPGDAVSDHLAGVIELPPPTLRTLEWLSGFETASSAIAAALSRPPPRVQPEMVLSNGRVALTLPGDAEHPEPDVGLEGPTRFTMREHGRFVSG